nr:hypothetical protein [Burkholderia cenocepacia]
MYGEHDPVFVKAQRANALALSNKQMSGFNHVTTHRVPESSPSRSSADFNRAHRSRSRLRYTANPRQFRDLGRDERTERNATGITQ